jgi:LCP family protein required for cell wall assembly
LILIILLVCCTIVAAFIFLRTDSIEERAKKNQFINILFTVSDKGKIVLIETFFYNPETRKGVILYVPNATWLMLEPLNRYDSIDKLYAPGNPKLLTEKIERLIDMKVPYFVDMELTQFAALVDLLGGIEIFIPATVNKKEGDKRFSFESGNIVIDGDKAADFLFVNFDNDAEMEKAYRKQDLLKSILDRIIQNSENGFLLKPAVLSYFLKCVSTNLTSRELETFISELQHLDVDNILYRRVHGTYRTQNNEQIYIPNDQGDQLKKTMITAVEFLKDSSKLRPEDMVVSLEILNGTETAFRARDTAKIYKKYGYEIVREDNATEKNIQKTVVIDRRGNRNIAQEIAAVIKCKNIETRVEERTPVDVTVIIGKDFDGQFCQ